MGDRAMSDRPSSQRPPNPLERFTHGGWRRGLWRVALALLLIAGVLWFTGEQTWAALQRPGVIPVVLAGAALHALQRFARIRKWALMLVGTELGRYSWRYLLRVQFMGLLANLLLPVSEALKVWAVARDRRGAWLASKSLAADLCIHTSAVGVVGALGCAMSSLAEPLPAAIWWAAAGVTLVPLVVTAILARDRAAFHLTSWTLWAWTLAEAGCQVAIYVLAMRAVGAEFSLGMSLAIAPLVYLSDLVMITPAGLGLREALFALVFAGLSNAPSELGVAAGLLISLMLFLTAAVGGPIAMLLPDGAPTKRSGSGGSVATDTDDLLE